MTDHAFLINCHREGAQTARLAAFLRGRYPGSRVIVHLDSAGHDVEHLQELGRHKAQLLVGDHQPDKCRGILSALNALVAEAARQGLRLVTLLHPDVVPTDRAQFRRFLLRFHAAKAALTWARMWPGHVGYGFIAPTFRLPEALRLFPIELSAEHEAERREAGEWCNELVAARSFDKSWPEWRCHAHPLAMLTMPYAGEFQDAGGAPVQKRMHDPFGSWAVHDYCPETSCLHTHDPFWWDNLDTLVRD